MGVHVAIYMPRFSFDLFVPTSLLRGNRHSGILFVLFFSSAANASFIHPYVFFWAFVVFGGRRSAGGRRCCSCLAAVFCCHYLVR